MKNSERSKSMDGKIALDSTVAIRLRKIVMRIFKLFLAGFMGLIFSIPCTAQPLELSAVNTKKEVTVYVDGELFTVYKMRDDQKYPYFYPVNGPASGKSITTETSEPYPHHHSLFFGCDRVSGGNYWQEGNERGQIKAQTVALIKEKGKYIQFENECLWEREGAESPFKDERVVRISAPSKDIRIIDFAIRLTALMDVRIEKSNHALFAARVMPELSVQQGGTLINAEGESGEKDTFGKQTAWMDYAGIRDGVTEGIAILPHPSNRWHPCPWFTRDYGFFSPTPMQWLEDGYVDFKTGETLSMKYRVIIHSGDSKAVAIAELYDEWVKE